MRNEDGKKNDDYVDSLLHAFHVQFFAMNRQSVMPWESLEEILQTSDTSVIQDILQKTVLHPLCKKYPPSVKYRKIFLTELIKKHEATAAEPDDMLYEALAAVLCTEESTLCYTSYLLPTGESVTLCESIAAISEGTTGLVTWEAALCTAEWSIENPHLFSDRTVLELGSGAGLTGIVLCKTCHPRKYIFTDCHPSVLQGLRKNILINGFLLDSTSWDQTTVDFPNTSCAWSKELSVSVRRLDWATATEEKLSQLQADVVIATDVVYDPEIIPYLINVFYMLLTSRSDKTQPVIYVASTVRNPDTYQLFKDKLDNSGIGQEILPRPEKVLFPYDWASDIEILKLELEKKSDSYVNATI
ncbi:protein-lysine N-methyltransferase EEF2KMT-like [Protopterus annectens]|uniref:protein-lysine N-methyltransferase EEF2KMT-like n=1 Tax=Protopterus annectens TaxID=7888 RepID=UPI001CFAE011|nr:protein-lysine N-methyltransferase EEF2KMT-like [Protopterus annectens]